jgi:hypothetical protein
MTVDSVFYVGVDASKAKHAIAIAEGGRNGEVRYFGEIEATPAAVERFVRKLEKKARPPALLLRSRSDRLRALPPDRRAWSPLRCRCPLAGPQASGRAGQDEPARCGQPGAAAAGGRVEGNLGSRRGA